MGRPTKEQQAAKLAAQQQEETTEGTELAEVELTPEQKIETLIERCDKLEAIISRLAVNTGNGNWLREYGVERWTPEKKHMTKKYA